MELSEYLKKHFLTQKEFGRKVGVSQSHITNILSGRKSPSIRLTKRIEEETNGNVGLDDLLRIETTSRLKTKMKEK